MPGADGCDQLVYDGGAATRRTHKFAKDGSLPDLNGTRVQVHPAAAEGLHPFDKTKFSRMALTGKGVSEETTADVPRGAGPRRDGDAGSGGSRQLC